MSANPFRLRSLKAGGGRCPRKVSHLFAARFDSAALHTKQKTPDGRTVGRFHERLVTYTKDTTDGAQEQRKPARRAEGICGMCL